MASPALADIDPIPGFPTYPKKGEIMAKVQVEQSAPSTLKVPTKFNSVIPTTKPVNITPDASKIKMPKPAFKK